MIKIDNLRVKYGLDIILNNISFSFNNQKIYGLIGKNGAGKTTLLKSICRLLDNNTGDIYINDNIINNIDYLQLPITYIGDSPVYFRDMTVIEHMLLICKIKNYDNDKANKIIDNLLLSLKLEKYKNHFPNTLSKGTLQRMSIALSLIRDEKYILMDEPFNGLDPVQVTTVENIIISEKKKGKTIIVSSHDIDSLKNICDIYIILKDGKLIEYLPNEISKENISELISDSYGD